MDKLKTVLITGATGVIGFAIAKLIAEKSGYRLVILARNEKKAKHTVDDLIRETGNQKITWVIANLSRKAEIKALAKD